MRQVDLIFDALKKLVQKRKKVFNTLYAQNRYGWEKWLQVELAFSLEDVGAPEFEVPYAYVMPLSQGNTSW